MCGIAGIAQLNAQASCLATDLASLSRQLRHRGPDDEGYMLVDFGRQTTRHCIGDDSQPSQIARHIREEVQTPAHVGLTHRRLSILDVSAAGHQPMSSPDGRYHLIYNGEVYNFVELRKELEKEGCSFQSSSDTEVVLAALSTWGIHALQRFVGMFALAWLDIQEHHLLLARDPFGIKPLHYCQTASQFAFASEPRALLNLPGVSRQIDPQATYTYLRHNVTDHNDSTFFRDIRQLPPAHVLQLDLRTASPASISRFWSSEIGRDWTSDYPAAIDRLKCEFLESVRLHLRSDVPLSVMLSGGIDSSAVTMLTRRLLGPQAPLEAFSYISPDPRRDESRWVDIVVASAQANVHRVEPKLDTLTEDIDRVIESQQAPFGSLSIVAQYCVFRKIRESGIKVSLSGQGADELLGGYSPFVAARLASLVRTGHWLSAARFFHRGSQRWPGRKRLTSGVAQQLLPAFIEKPIRRVMGKQAVPGWMNRSWFLARDVAMESVREHRSGAAQPLKSALLDSLTRTNLPELLRYEDRNSMAHSVESRVPFLTTPLVSFLTSLPEEYIISDQCISKAIFRDAMRKSVPDAILDRQDKVAFSAPLKQWFPTLEPWIEATLSSDAAARMAPLDHAAVRAQWDLVRAGKKRPDNLLWRWVNLIRWAEQFQVAVS
ncbi:Asparagine synthetase [glutamine-hydrolyzing] 1 [Roseimaritima ulvae]|uniref:asparagine synthase (glutamine-hydrolyzing) n=2 Tax=Roseimaritima ulvae TaxID=980254 RepID=A0A5B9QME6_9BACT|nr:Asparagine synthetase [glutamine-hydrolyzing] 1 [Roseimaritima ulvae]